MTRENRNLLLNTILIVVVSTLLLLSFILYVPTTSADKIFGTKVETVNKEYFRLPSNIDKVEDVYKKGEHLGVLYTVTEENFYGPITLQVAIDDQGIILGIYQLVEQNYPEAHHSLEVHKYVNSLKWSRIQKPESIFDNVAKPTTSITLGTIDSILDTIAIHSLFKDKVVEEEPKGDVTFIEKLDNGNSVYEATGVYSYDHGEGRITFKFELDSELNLIDYEEVEYTHTGGNFKTNAIKFLDNLKEDNVNIKNIKANYENIDGTVGATRTVNGILDLLEKVYIFIMGDDEPRGDVTFIEKLDNGNSVYEATGVYSYDVGEGRITFKFELDSELNLIDYEEVEYTHTGGNFKTNAIKFLDNLKEDSVNIENIKDKYNDIDGNVGATRTVNGILDLIDKVYEYIKEEN